MIFFSLSSRYTRTPHLYAASMTSIQLTLKNLGQEVLTDVKVGAKSLSPGMSMHEFASLASLEPDSTQTVTIGINFNDSTQSAKFDLVASGNNKSTDIFGIGTLAVTDVTMTRNLHDLN